MLRFIMGFPTIASLVELLQVAALQLVQQRIFGATSSVAAGNLWRTQRYYPWTAPRNGGMLESLRVGLSAGAGERLNRSYAYNYFGDITSLTEDTNANLDSFTYDGLGRLTAAYGRTYSSTTPTG